MYLLGKPIDDITADDIQRLIDNSIPENRSLDYKKEIKLNKDGEKKEFLFDVSSFRNTEGGCIIYGIEEQKDDSGQNTGTPLKVSGISTENEDKLTQQIEDLVKNGTEPSISNLKLNFLNVDEAKVLILGISKGIGLPCMVTMNHSNKFYKRRNSGKFLVDIYELNDMFMHNKLLKDQINNFILSRVNDVRTGNVFPNILKDHSFFVHLIPFDFQTETNLDFRNPDQLNLTTRMKPLHSGGWNWMYNFDGFATFSQQDRQNIDSYDQVFRNGIYEAYCSSLTYDNRNGQKTIFGDHLIKDTEEKIKSGLSILKDLGVDPPIYVSISMINFQDVVLERAMRFSRPIVQTNLRLPIIQISSFSEPILETIKPIFDIIWQTVGFAESPIKG
ncbi:MAG: ATP-binding protein [Cyclobacteriaceae bacterium]